MTDTPTPNFRYCLVSDKDNKNFSIRTTQLENDGTKELTVKKDNNPIKIQRWFRGLENTGNLHIMKTIFLTSGYVYKIKFTKIPDSEQVPEHYQTLGILATATMEEIKSAYKTLALKYHPDKGGTNEQFQKIKEAHRVLIDETTRRDYDELENNKYDLDKYDDYGTITQIKRFEDKTEQRGTEPEKIEGPLSRETGAIISTNNSETNNLETTTTNLSESCIYDKSESKVRYGLQILSVSRKTTELGTFDEITETFTLSRTPTQSHQTKQQLKIDPSFPLFSNKMRPQQTVASTENLDDLPTFRNYSTSENGYSSDLQIFIRPKDVGYDKKSSPIVSVLIIIKIKEEEPTTKVLEKYKEEQRNKILEKLNMDLVEKYYAGDYKSTEKDTSDGFFINFQLFLNSGLTCEISEGMAYWYGFRDFFFRLAKHTYAGSLKSKKKSPIRMKKRISKKKINKTSKNLRKKKNKKYISKRRGI